MYFVFCNRRKILYFVYFVFCKMFTIHRQKHGVVRKYPLLYSRFVNKK
nr:MAG TPA: hypothetical protein [Caudoviricetes sp.]